MPKRKLMLILGYSGVGMLGVLALAMLFPVVRQESFAACVPGSSAEDCTAMPISTEVGVTTNTVISLAIANQVNLELTPKSTGATATASTKLAVSTNSNDGYALYLQTGREDGSLTGVTSNLSSAITNTEKTGVLLGELELNSYGYALSQTAVDNNTTYSRVPTTSTAIKTTHQVGETTGEYGYGDTYYLAFGTKIGTNLPAGQYAGTVTVSAVANPTTLRSMYDLTYMQDMTSDICENTKEHYTKQLIDTRDGKSYWVAKLKDGNCWMVQNLALDLDVNSDGNAVAVSENGAKVVLDGSNTDIVGNWGNTTTTIPRATNRHALGSTHSDDSLTDSWSFGKIVFVAPRLYLGELIRTVNSIDEVASVIDVSGSEWQPTFKAREGTITREDFVRKTVSESDGTTKVTYVPRSKAASENADKDEAGNYIPFTYTGLVAADLVAKTYDAHYLLGNYYQYRTGVAGRSINSAGTAINGNVHSVNASICPKGWRLPISGSVNNTVDGSFYNMLQNYGWHESLWNVGDLLGAEPTYFVTGGLIFDNPYRIDSFGSLGYYGASSYYNGENKGIYYFAFTNSWSGVNYGTYGIGMAPSLRCLSR